MGTDTDEEYLKKDSSMSREVQSTGLRVFLGFSAGFSCLIVGFSIFQLVRIHVRLWQLRFQSRRLNFLAKRLFHVFLGLAFLVNFASTVFDLTSFCFANPKRDEAWWCFPVDATLKRLFSFLTLSAYLITLLFWTEFVYCIKYNAATGEYFIKYKRHIYAVTAIIITVFIVYVIMIFCHHDGYLSEGNFVTGPYQIAVDTVCMYLIGFAFCAAGIGIIWKGYHVIKYAKEVHSENNKRTVIKLFVLIVICSVLLLFRSLWAMIGYPLLQFGVMPHGAIVNWILFIFGEFTPSVAMIILMYPLPSPPVKFASRRIQSEYRIIKMTK